MKCISPLTFKKKGIVTTVPCGECGFCLKEKADAWYFRLKKELEVSKSAFFVTLTYSDENVPMYKGNQTLRRSDLKLFNKRLRTYNFRSPWYEGKWGWKLKYYSVGEYGSKSGRPHYHMIVFNMKPSLKSKLDKVWNLGFVHVGTVTNKSIRYVVDYVITKKMENENGKIRDKEFAFISKGIGEAHIEGARVYHKNSGNYFSILEGNTFRTPRYYGDKIYNKIGRSINSIKRKSFIQSTRERSEREIERLGYDNPEWELEKRMREKNENILKIKSKKL